MIADSRVAKAGVVGVGGCIETTAGGVRNQLDTPVFVFFLWSTGRCRSGAHRRRSAFASSLPVAILDTDPTWAERAGSFAIESLGVQLYRGILLKRSPHEFLTQSVSLFQLYYHPGDMTVVLEDPGLAVLRLVGFDAGRRVLRVGIAVGMSTGARA